MIYCLTGKLLEKAPDYAVVSCGGVGYLAAIPSTTAGALPAVGDTCTLYTCMNVTENDVSLFGFADKESQTMFRLLTGVSGVGPKLGQRIVLELKDKVGKGLATGLGLADASGTAAPAATGGVAQAIAALTGLGYTGSEAAQAIARLDPSLPVQELIRLALQGIGKGR